MKIRTRRALIASIVVTQVSVLAIGWFISIYQLRKRLALEIEDYVVEANLQAADDLATDLDGITEPVEYGSPSWQRLQDKIEALDLPGAGFACVLDAEGYVLCHPELDEDPSLRSLQLGAHQFIDPRSGNTVALNDAPPGQVITGRLNFLLGGTHFIATRGTPHNGLRLVVHQPDRGMISMSAGMLAEHGIIPAGLTVAIVTLTTLGSVLIIRRYRDALEEVNVGLEREITERVDESMAARNALIFGLAKLADYRDTDTGAHLDRIGAYAKILAEGLRSEHDEINDRWIERLVLASSLHDIGKVGIPDSILLKPGKLDNDERLAMQQHPLIGADTLLAIRRKLGTDQFIEMGIEIALQHHERWDGAGYPFGLSGSNISLSGRIVALADFYDALTSVRVYKDAVSHEDTRKMVQELSGAHFDPQIADAFERNHKQFDEVRRNLQPRGRPDLPKLVEIAERFLGERRSDGRAAA